MTQTLRPMSLTPRLLLLAALLAPFAPTPAAPTAPAGTWAVADAPLHRPPGGQAASDAPLCVPEAQPGESEATEGAPWVTGEAEADIDTTWVAAMPVVHLTYDTLLADAFTPGSVTIYEADTTRRYPCRVRRRGNTSLRYDKPSYAIKVLSPDGSGEAHDVRIAGLRKDNNWLLGAMVTDPARTRNRVASDLWLDLSVAPCHQDSEPKAVNGSRGSYVEVWANRRYMGLYELMERIDRKQLRLKKFRPAQPDAPGQATATDTLRGVLYKAIEWGRSTMFYYQTQAPDDAVATWDGFQASYPDLDDGEPFTWSPLRTAIYRLAVASRLSIASTVETYFDRRLVDDYFLFINLVAATDNSGKNYYAYIYDLTSADRRLSIAPWDLDCTFGLSWRGDHEGDTLHIVGRKNYLDLMYRLCPGYDDLICRRWAEWRQGGLSADALTARFAEVHDLLHRTGALDRERRRWAGLHVIEADPGGELPYLTDWIARHIERLDSVYRYDAADAAIAELRADMPPADAPVPGLPEAFRRRGRRLVYVAGQAEAR